MEGKTRTLRVPSCKWVTVGWDLDKELDKDDRDDDGPWLWDGDDDGPWLWEGEDDGPWVGDDDGLFMGNEGET
ncbi:hypothetical protein SLEP1_g7801 [Rubroshorea leprosula]|uniref:Uncharacterized protein n=1 Tax=Rubroshorea leprosula TaxID=152421 RepID=A0AAV5HZJ5_9ROSI|nr:hypothetical protein SLEP1_g7801 [Rubroshorea leprosula]